MQRMAFRHEKASGGRRSSGLTHTVVGTAANVSDVVMEGDLLHGAEYMVFADADYTSVANHP